MIIKILVHICIAVLAWVVMLPTHQRVESWPPANRFVQKLLKNVTFFTVSQLTAHQSTGIGYNLVSMGTNITLTCHINYMGSAQTSPELYACAWAQTGAETAAGQLKVLRLLTISPYRDEVSQKRKKTAQVLMWAPCTPIWGTCACSNRSESLPQAPKWPKMAQKQWKTVILSRLSLISPAWAVRWWPNPGTSRNYVSMLAMQNGFPNAQILTDI